MSTETTKIVVSKSVHTTPCPKTPKRICQMCYNREYTENPWGKLEERLWEKSCKGNGLWECPAGTIDGNDRIKPTEEYPPKWCPWIAEMIMLKPDHEHPRPEEYVG